MTKVKYLKKFSHVTLENKLFFFQKSVPKWAASAFRETWWKLGMGRWRCRISNFGVESLLHQVIKVCSGILGLIKILKSELCFVYNREGIDARLAWPPIKIKRARLTAKPLQDRVLCTLNRTTLLSVLMNILVKNWDTET